MLSHLLWSSVTFSLCIMSLYSFVNVFIEIFQRKQISFFLPSCVSLINMHLFSIIMNFCLILNIILWNLFWSMKKNALIEHFFCIDKDKTKHKNSVRAETLKIWHHTVSNWLCYATIALNCCWQCWYLNFSFDNSIEREKFLQILTTTDRFELLLHLETWDIDIMQQSGKAIQLNIQCKYFPISCQWYWL